MIARAPRAATSCSRASSASCRWHADATVVRGPAESTWSTPAGESARLVPERHAAQASRLSAFDAVLMRKDPPFDMEYVYATYLLELAQREGARVFNDPRAMRDHNEKLAIAEFPQFTAPTLVTRDRRATCARSSTSTATRCSSCSTAWAAVVDLPGASATTPTCR